MDSLTENDCFMVKEYLEILINSTRHKSPEIIPLEALNGLRLKLKNNSYLKMIATGAGARDILLKILLTFNQETKVVRSTLKTITCLVDRDPNWMLNDREIACQMDLLKNFLQLENADGIRSWLRPLIRWLKISSVKNEANRRAIFNAGVTNSLKIILKSKNLTALELREVYSLFGILALDDDPGFECGYGVFRARGIAGEVVADVAASLEKFKGDKRVASQVFGTLNALLVRNEFSKILYRSGGIEAILKTIDHFENDEEICCLGLRLLRISAEDEEVKVGIVNHGAAPLVLSILRKIQTGSSAVSGLSCVAALTLRNPRNCEVFYDLEALSLTIETMKRYPGSLNVQRQGARVVSNMLEGIYALRKIDPTDYPERDTEEVLETAMRLHAGDIEDRHLYNSFDKLGLGVELKRRWTKTPKDSYGRNR